MSTIDEVLAAHPTAVAAWDIELGPDEILTIFDTAEGARRVAEANYPRAERPDVTIRLELRGVPVGAHDLRGGVLWVSTAERFALWTATEQTLVVTQDGFTLADGRVLPREGEVEVTAELEADGTCTVFFKAGTDAHPIAAVESDGPDGPDGPDGVAGADEADGGEGGFVDTQWARALGRALAKWCDGRFVDRT